MAQPLVLLHGALGAGEQLQPLAQLLAETHETRIYEFPGHGQRAAEITSFNIETLAADFHQWLQKNYTIPVNVFGYSMGGYVSLHLATVHPQLFEKTVTLGTKFRWSVEEAAKETSKLDPIFLLSKAPAYCQYLEKLHGAEWKNVLGKTAGLMRQLGERPLLNDITLSLVKGPVHLMLGELDKMVSRDETEHVQKQLPAASFQLLEGFVHPLERLDPGQLAAVLQKSF